MSRSKGTTDRLCQEIEKVLMMRRMLAVVSLRRERLKHVVCVAESKPTLSESHTCDMAGKY